MITTSIATVSKITLNECWIRFVVRTAIRFEELIVRIFGIEVLVSEEAYFFWDSALELSIVDLTRGSSAYVIALVVKHHRDSQYQHVVLTQLLAESQLRRQSTSELITVEHELRKLGHVPDL
jgi:hypothetical protein